MVDYGATNPGPIDNAVLYDQDKHVSSAVWEGQERGALRCHEHTSKLDQWMLTGKQIELVKKAGFGYLRMIPAISLDNPLISALVERWRRETNTFHFTVGEMTVTLEDVAYLLGLPVDGEAVIGVTYTSCEAVCIRLLGRAPDSRYTSGGMVKLSWLKETFSHCPRDASMEEIECHTRAYLLYLCWSYYHLNVGRPKLNHDPIHECFPFVLRWKGKPSSPTSNRDVAFYRKAMDSMEPSDVDWCPYSNISHTVIPDHILRSLILGRSKTMLICYDKAERHLPDRCLRQFGMHQTVPEEVQKWERKSGGVDGGVDLSTKMESELSEWSNRHLYIVEAEEDVEESEYMQWYLNITRKLVGRPIPISSEFQRMNAALREIAHIADTLSTHGMDDQQLQSVSRIQYIAYECLRDQITNTVVAANSQSEVEKRVRGKERVRRKGPGKRKRKNEIDQYYTAGITVQSRLPAATFDADHAHLYHVSNEVDDPHICLTVSEGDHVRMSHVAQSVDDMEFCEDDNEVDESHFHHVAEVDGQFSSELAEDKPHASIDIVPQASRETREDVPQQNDYGVLV